MAAACIEAMGAANGIHSRGRGHVLGDGWSREAAAAGEERLKNLNSQEMVQAWMQNQVSSEESN